MAKRNHGRKESWYCLDGPYKGRELLLHTGGTLSFSVPSYKNGETGRYVRDIGNLVTDLVLGIRCNLPSNRLRWEPSCQQARPSM